MRAEKKSVRGMPALPLGTRLTEPPLLPTSALLGQRSPLDQKTSEDARACFEKLQFCNFCPCVDKVELNPPSSRLYTDAHPGMVKPHAGGVHLRQPKQNDRQLNIGSSDAWMQKPAIESAGQGESHRRPDPHARLSTVIGPCRTLSRGKRPGSGACLDLEFPG